MVLNMVVIHILLGQIVTAQAKEGHKLIKYLAPLLLYQMFSILLTWIFCTHTLYTQVLLTSLAMAEAVSDIFILVSYLQLFYILKLYKAFEQWEIAQTEETTCLKRSKIDMIGYLKLGHR